MAISADKCTEGESTVPEKFSSPHTRKPPAARLVANPSCAYTLFLLTAVAPSTHLTTVRRHAATRVHRSGEVAHWVMSNTYSVVARTGSPASTSTSTSTSTASPSTSTSKERITSASTASFLRSHRLTRRPRPPPASACRAASLAPAVAAACTAQMSTSSTCASAAIGTATPVSPARRKEGRKLSVTIGEVTVVELGSHTSPPHTRRKR
jgi:hypothetical protein